MKPKIISFAVAFTLLGMTSTAQIKDTLDKLAKDPGTREMAAKADVYIVTRDRKIYDTVLLAQQVSPGVQREKIDRKRKRPTTHKKS